MDAVVAQAAESESETKKTKSSKSSQKTSYSQGSYPYADRLPEWNDEYWRYVNDNDQDGLRNWVKGTAWPKADEFEKTFGDRYTWASFGGKESWKTAHEELQKDDYTKNGGVKIAILYKPNCPYTKSALPKFKKIALEAKAKILLGDIDKYRSGSLAPYYDVLNVGVKAPTVVYVDKDGNLRGKSGVDTASEFAKILQECGYTTGVVDNGDRYTQEDLYREQLLAETNRERLAKGLLPLSMFRKVNDVADLRAKEIVEKMEHTRPDGTSYSTALVAGGVNGPNLYGENIAGGPAVADPWSVNEAWMNSPGHRANILRPTFTHIGIGHYSHDGSGNHKYKDHWVQLFLGTCQMDSMSVDAKTLSVMKGTPLADMNLTVTLHCSTHGDSTMPLIDEMVTGYDPNKEGEQVVTVHYGDMTQKILVNVGNTEPEELTEEMIDIQFTGAQTKTTKSGEEVAEYEYTGNAIRPTVNVTNPTGEYALMEGYSYDIRYENNVNAGTGKIIVTGKGNYKGTIEKTFKINPKNVQNDLEIAGIKESYEYNGSAIKPTVTVKLKNGQVLYQGTDFKVEYGDNTGELIKKPGNAVQVNPDSKGTVTVTGIGNYTGTKTADFSFTMSTKQKAAETLAFVVGPTSAYNSMTEMIDTFKSWSTDENQPSYKKKRYKEYMETTYETIIEYSKSLGQMEKWDLTGSFTSKEAQLKEAIKEESTKKGYQEMMTESLSPDTAKYVNEWIDYVQKEQGIDVANTKKVENTVSELTSVSVEGLASMVSKSEGSSTETAQLKITQGNTDTSDIDPVKYDTVDAIPVKLAVNVNNEEKTTTQPLTISMKIPDQFSTANEIVALRSSSKAKSSVEEIPVVIDKEKNTMSFTTTELGDFVLTQKLPQYEVEQTLQPANNPEISGVSFGELSNEGPAAVSDLKVYQDKDKKIQVSWKAADQAKGWDLTGYELKYSQNEDMSHAQAINVDKDKTSVTLDQLPAGKYYFTVTSKVKSDFTDEATRQSLVTMLEVPGEVTEKLDPTYQIKTTAGKNGSLAVTVDKKQKASNTAQEGDTVKVTSTPNSGYLNARVQVTDAEGNAIATKQEGNIYTFTMPAKDVTISSMYTEEVTVPKMYSVTLGSMTNGNIILDTAQVPDGKAAEGTTITFTAMPNEGYDVDKVEAKTASSKTVELKKGDNNQYSFEMPSEAVTLIATFKQQEKPVEPEEPEEKPEEKPEEPEQKPEEKPENTVTDEKDYSGKLTVSSSSAKLYKTTDLDSSSSVKQGTVYDGVQTLKIKGTSYYKVKQDKTEGYIKSSDVKKLESTKLGQKVVTKANKTIWGNLFFTNKKGTTKNEQLFEARYVYELGNGDKYYSLYDGKGKWAGYLSAKDASPLKATDKTENKVGSKDYTLWNDLFFNKKKGTLKVEKLYQAQRSYKVNGNTYYSLYEVKKDKSVWAGYVNAKALKNLKTATVKDEKVTVTKKSAYTRWKDLFFNNKKGSTKQGEVYTVKRYYDYNNGRYYSLYRTNSKGKEEWMGYVNKDATTPVKAKKVNKKVTVVKKNYTMWGNFFWTSKKGNTTKYYKKKVVAKYEYKLGNGARYYSVYDSKNKWLGYVNKDALK